MRVLFAGALTVAAMIGGIADAADPKPSGQGAWFVDETVDPIDDRRSLVFSLQGEGGILIVGCRSTGSGQRSIAFRPSRAYLGSVSNAYRNVVVRFDDDAAISESWAHTDTLALQTRGDRVAALLDRLNTSKRLAVRATSYRGEAFTGVFNVEGAAAIVSQLTEACAGGGSKPADGR